jgi:hypothetical protein
MIDIDLEFPHSYEIEEVPEFPGTGNFNVQVRYFPKLETRPEHDGIWLQIRPATAQPWVGVFGFGDGYSPFISRVVSTPDKDRVCVISGGSAYIVKADEPEIWEGLAVRPVRDVRMIPEHQLLVFADFTRLIAYGRNQVAWKRSELCLDDLKILNVSSDKIEGVGYDPTNPGSKSNFSVDIKTGESLYPGPVSTNGKLAW